VYVQRTAREYRFEIFAVNEIQHENRVSKYIKKKKINI